VLPLHEQLTTRARPALFAFGAAAVLVLVVACANVATILVGRTAGRRRELAVCRAIGASPSRLLLTVVSEALLIAGAGTALGVLLATAGVSRIRTWAAGILPRLAEVSLDWTVLLFACAIAALSAVLGAVPAIRMLGPGDVGLREASSAGPVAARTRTALVIGQIALAVVLLAGGGLLTRTIVALLTADIGIERRGAAISELMLTETTTFDATGRTALVDDLLQRIRALPAVRAAGIGSSLPPDNAQLEIRVRLVDRHEAVHTLSLTSATPGYLEAIGARLVRGRLFEAADNRRDRPVAVMSASAARALMPAGDPIGEELPIELPGLRTRGRPVVAGVVSDIKYSGLDVPPGPAVYVAWTELPAGRAYLAVRTDGDPLAAAPAIRDILRRLDSGMPVVPIKTLDEVVQGSVADRRARALLGGAVALLAFSVALIGLVANLVRLIRERRRELAIRSALGAAPSDAVRMVLRESLAVAAIGVAIGTACALAAGRALASLLHGVSPNDPATLGYVAVLVIASSALSAVVPARRAARVDPAQVLRDADGW
jgi:predicted permease